MLVSGLRSHECHTMTFQYLPAYQPTSQTTLPYLPNQESTNRPLHSPVCQPTCLSIDAPTYLPMVYCFLPPPCSRLCSPCIRTPCKQQFPIPVKDGQKKPLMYLRDWCNNERRDCFDLFSIPDLKKCLWVCRSGFDSWKCVSVAALLCGGFCSAVRCNTL